MTTTKTRTLQGSFRCDNEETWVEVNTRIPQIACLSKPSWLPFEHYWLREQLNEEIRCNAPIVDSPFLTATYWLDAAIFYQPWFFIWFPHCLVDRIPCPACPEACRQPMSGFLQEHGHTDRCRQAVVVNRNVYIVGYCYLCGHPDCKWVYQSYSQGPSSCNCLLIWIPAHLPQRAITPVDILLQNSFRLGIGLSQFTTMIESFHYQYCMSRPNVLKWCRTVVLEAPFLNTGLP